MGIKATGGSDSRGGLGHRGLAFSLVTALSILAIIAVVASGWHAPRPALGEAGAVQTTTQATTPTIDLPASPTPPATAAYIPKGESLEHFWLYRPIPTEGEVRVERYYPYGSRGGEGELPIHHGVEFVNPQGTAVLAAGTGRVVAAGSDAQVAYGPQANFYGNVVIVELEERFRGKSVFTLYGHLSQVLVKVGQEVARGDILGRVGMTGVAMGPHLHFEVRVGENHYGATRNPELWLKPLPDHGVIAGRVMGRDGEPLSGVYITFLPLGYKHAFWRATATYPHAEVNPDESWGENFVMGDVPAGKYLVSFQHAGQKVRQEVEVKAEQMIFLNVVLG